MSTKKVLTLAGVTLTALMLAGAGCTDSATTNTNTANTNANTNKTTTVTNTNKSNTNKNTNTATESDYAIAITAPEDGDNVENPINVEVDIEEFELSDDVEGANVEGEGHYHVWVDGEYLMPSTEPEVELTDLDAGEHEIMVSLQNNDHTDLATPVKSEAITVTVE